jgi:hypothetical protein
MMMVKVVTMSVFNKNRPRELPPPLRQRKRDHRCRVFRSRVRRGGVKWTAEIDVPGTLVVGKFKGNNGGCCGCELVSERGVGNEDGSAVGVGVGKAERCTTKPQ